MKKKTIKTGLLVALSVFFLCSCGIAAEIDEEPGDGADWRSTGIVNNTGILVAEDGETDVCAVLFEDKTELYYNKEEKELYLTIDFPEPLSKEEYENAVVSFDDLTGDDYSDITIGIDVDGAIRRFSYVYDGGDYVYMEALTYPPKNYDEVDFSGAYTEPDTGRCYIEITNIGGGRYNIDIQWSNGASDSECWTMEDAELSASGTELEYTNAKYFSREYSDDTNYDDGVHYTDGSGKFWFDEDGMLNWVSDNSDVDGVDGTTVFEKME